MDNKLSQYPLGKTGLQVTEFCLGILPMGPLYANLSLEECVGLIHEAMDLGVNFFDTAEVYRTQPYLGRALAGRRGEAIVATKSAARDYNEMKASVERSLQELETDFIDIYHLHAPRPSGDVFLEREGALQCLLDEKGAGLIKAVGIATHDVTVAEKAAERDDIDVIFPLVNIQGLGVVNGSKEDMLRAIGKAREAGKGLYVMKALGGGNLIALHREAINWAREIPGVSSLAIGVISGDELRQDLSAFGLKTGMEGVEVTIKNKRLFIFEKICKGCGECIQACHNDALFFQDDIPRVDHNKCLLCGYCSAACPMFAIRVL